MKSHTLGLLVRRMPGLISKGQGVVNGKGPNHLLGVWQLAIVQTQRKRQTIACGSSLVWDGSRVRMESTVRVQVRTVGRSVRTVVLTE